MEQKDVQELIRKYQDGTCNEAERKQLEMHLLQYLGREGSIPSEDLLERAAANNFRAIMAAISRKTTEDLPSHKKFVFRYGWYAAAIIPVALAVALYFYPGLIADRSSKIINDIVPGGNRATLTLANGIKVALDSAQSGIIVGNEGIKYQSGKVLPGVILSEGQGSYKSGGRHSVPQNPAGQQAGTAGGEFLLELSTPRGGQYQIILSDGTKVWLNAASKLKYPKRFTGDRREVELEGEAYFSVNNNPSLGGRHGSRQTLTQTSKSYVPFIVKTHDQEVQVIGTEFNLSSYNDEKETKTTLVTGGVRVTNSAGERVSLASGEQAVSSDNHLIRATADVGSNISWREGVFTFQGKSFIQIMRELSRWYNLEVEYEGPIPDNTYFGSAYRDDKLSVVLGLLKSSNIHYRLDGRKLIISKNH